MGPPSPECVSCRNEPIFSFLGAPLSIGAKAVRLWSGFLGAFGSRVPYDLWTLICTVANPKMDDPGKFAVANQASLYTTFPRLRWVALAWLLVWGPSYAWIWGWTNFLHLCDLAVILTCVGLWRGSRLLISTQALSSIVPALFWDVDFAWRLFSGKHLIGGTEYMWDGRFPLGVRLLSLFHVAWPVLLIWALGKVRYDRRALPLQTAFAVVVLVVSRCIRPDANLNFAWRDPFLHQSLGPAWLHLAITASALVVCVYWPTHWLLAKLFPGANSTSGNPQQRRQGVCEE